MTKSAANLRRAHKSETTVWLNLTTTGGTHATTLAELQAFTDALVDEGVGPDQLVRFENKLSPRLTVTFTRAQKQDSEK